MSAGHGSPPPPRPRPTIDVQEDFVVYRCKIGNGKVIELPLPMKLTKLDATKIYRFLETQVDDGDEG